MSAFTAIRSTALRLSGSNDDYDALLQLVGDRSLVLLGEATHGTREFYRMRAEITRRLIEEKGFDAIAVEADWPDAYRLNRYVRGSGDDSIDAAFGDFERFPTWMWRNKEVRDFIAWLRVHNVSRAVTEHAGFYGLDLYSLYRSAEAVIAYLDRVDPEEAQMARRVYGCLDHVHDPQAYGLQAAFGQRKPCHDAAVRQVCELRGNAARYLAHDGQAAEDEQFFAEQNARIVMNAEVYYRAMFGSRINTWNLRDDHMTDTLFALQRHLQAQGRRGRIVVWAHNSHVGDARATEMGRSGEHNIGQLVRLRAGRDALLVGFTTYTGHVSAASAWDAPVAHRWVRPAIEGSWEQLFYRTHLDRFFLPLNTPASESLRVALLQRAIGVIYRPDTERQSHYFHASLARQFDAVFHLDETTAVEPIDAPSHWHEPELPETYPFGV